MDNGKNININEKEAEILDRMVNHEPYLKKMSNEELIDIFNKFENYDEVSTALTELSIRDKYVIIPLCQKIFTENLGDEFLQAVAFNLLYDGDREKAIKMVDTIVEQVPAIVLGSIMDNLSTDSLQEFGRTLSIKILQSIVNRYIDLSETEKEKVSENWKWFKESYQDKLSNEVLNEKGI